jgi:hypothetical protein
MLKGYYPVSNDDPLSHLLASYLTHYPHDEDMSLDTKTLRRFALWLVNNNIGDSINDFIADITSIILEDTMLDSHSM